MITFNNQFSRHLNKNFVVQNQIGKTKKNEDEPINNNLLSKQNTSKKREIAFRGDPITLIVGGLMLLKGLLASASAILLIGYATNAFEESRKRATERLKVLEHKKIAELHEKNPHLPLKHIEQIYKAKLEKTLIEPKNDGHEVGLNKAMGFYDLKFALCDKVLMPLCEILDGKNKQNEVPNGINFFGTPGTGKTYIAKALGEHYEEKGGYFKEVHFSNNPVKDTENLRNMFSDAEKRFIDSGKKKYTIMLFDEIEKSLDKNDPSNRSTTAELLKLTDNCKNKGVIFVTTSNYPQNIEPSLMRKGRTDLIMPLRGIEDFEFADTVNYYMKKNGIRNNIKSTEYADIINALSPNGKFVFRPMEIEHSINNAYSDVEDYGGYLKAENVKNSLLNTCSELTEDNENKLAEDKAYIERIGGKVYDYQKTNK